MQAWLSWCLWLRVSHGAAIKASLGSFLSGARGPLPSSCGCGLNSVPCSCRTEVPVSLLYVSWGLSQQPGATCGSLTCGP